MGFYGLAGALILAAIAGAFSIGFGKGSASRNGEIASLTASIEVSKREAAAAEKRAAETAAQVVTVYKDRIKTIREKEPAEIQIVERIVREIDPNCTLPSSYVRMWNGEPAAGSSAGEDSGGIDAGAVPLAELPEKTRLARKAFDENLAQLEAWRSFAKENGWVVQ